jgi:hypothetical protein
MNVPNPDTDDRAAAAGETRVDSTSGCNCCTDCVDACDATCCDKCQLIESGALDSTEDTFGGSMSLYAAQDADRERRMRLREKGLRP